jgi:hypothetical protein
MVKTKTQINKPSTKKMLENRLTFMVTLVVGDDFKIEKTKKKIKVRSVRRSKEMWKRFRSKKMFSSSKKDPKKASEKFEIVVSTSKLIKGK